MQPKGGVGKSYVAFVMKQRLDKKPGGCTAYDLDPLNRTFSAFKALGVKQVDILADQEGALDNEAADRLIDEIVSAKGPVIVDTGSSTFVSVAGYLLTNDLPEILLSYGKRLVIHVPLVGGQLAVQTMLGLEAIAEQFPENVPIVVWINEHTGPFRPEGLYFDATPLYERFKDRMSMVWLPQLNPKGAGRYVKAMLDKHQTFAEASAAATGGPAATDVVSAYRLDQVRTSLYDRLDAALERL